MERRFAVRLKYARESFGYTQAEFSNMLGVTRQTLGNYETGDRTPDVDFLKKLCQITSWSPRFFLCFQDSIKDENASFVNATGLWDQTLETFCDYRENAELLNRLFATDFFWKMIRRVDTMLKEYRKNPRDGDAMWAYESYLCDKQFVAFLDWLHDKEWNLFVKNQGKTQNDE